MLKILPVRLIRITSTSEKTSTKIGYDLMERAFNNTTRKFPNLYSGDIFELVFNEDFQHLLDRLNVNNAKADCLRSCKYHDIYV